MNLRILIAVPFLLLAEMQVISGASIALETRGQPPRNVNAHTALHRHEAWGKLLDPKFTKPTFKPALKKSGTTKQSAEKTVSKIAKPYPEKTKPKKAGGSSAASHSPGWRNVKTHSPDSSGAHSTVSTATSRLETASTASSRPRS